MWPLKGNSWTVPPDDQSSRILCSCSFPLQACLPKIYKQQSDISIYMYIEPVHLQWRKHQETAASVQLKARSLNELKSKQSHVHNLTVGRNWGFMVVSAVAMATLRVLDTDYTARIRHPKLAWFVIVFTRSVFWNELVIVHLLKTLSFQSALFHNLNTRTQ